MLIIMELYYYSKQRPANIGLHFTYFDPL